MAHHMKEKLIVRQPCYSFRVHEPSLERTTTNSSYSWLHKLHRFLFVQSCERDYVVLWFPQNRPNLISLTNKLVTDKPKQRHFFFLSNILKHRRWVGFQIRRCCYNLLLVTMLLCFVFGSTVVKEYVEVVKEVTCEILDLVVEGLGVGDKFGLSRLIRDYDSDSVLRMNHYPPMKVKRKGKKNSIGFGAHSDPQMLTIMRSNDVGGLQIYTRDGLWLPVPPDPTNFFVMVGDVLQVLSFLTFTIHIHFEDRKI